MIIDVPEDSINGAILLACLNSFSFDFVARCKQGGRNLSQYIFNQLAVPADSLRKARAKWDDRTAQSQWILHRVLELTFSAWDLEAFAADCGYDGPPFRWDEQRRFQIRCELDAAFYLLFGLTADTVSFTLDTFWVVKERDEKAHGEYRTKRVILEIYDAMAEAIRTGHPYQTRLDPPPGPPTDPKGNFIPLANWSPSNWPPHIHPPRDVETAELSSGGQE